jgi:myo-inositol 2-dehydrogenase/D-chiro-inositol 1-dehydrogenase
MTAEIRVAFLGGVRHARAYAQRLREDPGATIVGVADEAGAPTWIRRAGAELADTLGVPWTADVDALLDASVDLVVVCSEPTRHARLGVAALHAGADVCIDKPVATTVADAASVVRAASESSGLCAVVNRTFSPAVQRLRAWVDAGYLGLPRHIDVEFLAGSDAFAADVENPLLVVDPALSGGGELRNFLGYAVDAVRFLTGLEVEEVYAEASTLFGGAHAEHAVEDAGIASLLLNHGVTTTVTIGRVPAVPTVGTGHSTIRLIGSHGDAVASDERPRLLRFSDGEVSSVAVGGADAALDSFFTDLLASVRERRIPTYSVGDAAAGVAVVDAAYRSSTQGRNVVLGTDGQHPGQEDPGREPNRKRHE